MIVLRAIEAIWLLEPLLLRVPDLHTVPPPSCAIHTCHYDSTSAHPCQTYRPAHAPNSILLSCFKWIFTTASLHNSNKARAWLAASLLHPALHKPGEQRPGQEKHPVVLVPAMSTEEHIHASSVILPRRPRSQATQGCLWNLFSVVAA